MPLLLQLILIYLYIIITICSRDAFENSITDRELYHNYQESAGDPY